MSGIFAGIQPLTRALDYHSERHNVLASNVANVDTPGFRPAELLRELKEATPNHMSLAATKSGHIQANGTHSADHKFVREERVTGGGLDGNSVSLEREMAKLATNDIRFDTAARIVARKIGMLRYAASDATQG